MGVSRLLSINTCDPVIYYELMSSSPASICYALISLSIAGDDFIPTCAAEMTAPTIF